jgi:hypothetical protein
VEGPLTADERAQLQANSLQEAAFLQRGGESGTVGRSALVAHAESCGFDGAMLARAAMWNPSVFAEAPPTTPTTSGPASASASAPSVGAQPTGAKYRYNRDVLHVLRQILIATAATGETARQLKYHMVRTLQEFFNLDKGTEYQRRCMRQHDALNRASTLEEIARAIEMSEAEVLAVAAFVEIYRWRVLGGVDEDADAEDAAGDDVKDDDSGCTACAGERRERG